MFSQTNKLVILKFKFPKSSDPVPDNSWTIFNLIAKEYPTASVAPTIAEVNIKFISKSPKCIEPAFPEDKPVFANNPHFYNFHHE